MRTAVMGTGGTGGYFGGRLARAGEDVTFIARGAHLEAMRARGLTVKSQLAGDFHLPVQATDDPRAVGPVDLVLFCVKAYDTEAAAAQMRPLLGPGTVVLPLQNGIDTVERIAAVVGGDHLIGGVALISSTIEGPGTIAQTAGLGKILLGEVAGGISARTASVYGLLHKADIAAAQHPDVYVAMWDKFIFICAFSGITALTRLPIGAVLASQPCRDLLHGVMEEAALVARAMDVAIQDDSVKRGMALAESFQGHARGSLYQDLSAGRRLELDALNGTVVRLGRQFAVPTPLNFAVYAALEPYIAGTPAV